MNMSECLRYIAIGTYILQAHFSIEENRCFIIFRYNFHIALFIIRYYNYFLLVLKKNYSFWIIELTTRTRRIGANRGRL